MSRDWFQLALSVERLVQFNGAIRPVRVEVFESGTEPPRFRARVFATNTYDLLPSALNSAVGVSTLVSEDSIPCDITNSALCTEKLVLGMEGVDREYFLRLVVAELDQFFDRLDATER